MKPLSLEMTAFGPYGGSASVDFDRLSRVGLFVVAGPTGSGKTSIFDAMSYALFGKLPGERSDFLQVRSDHADPETACQVGFEFDVDGQRWRVTRRPAWVRAKKRGAGTTEEAARASLDKWSDGAWVPVEAKSRAVTERCEELVGLSQEQFQRVVLLPQGQFQQVLKADSLERRGLLRTLFASGLYERLEDSLKDAAKTARIELAEMNRGQKNDLANAVSGLRLARKALQIDDDALSGGDSDPDDEPDLTPAEVQALAEAFSTGPLTAARHRLVELDENLTEAAKRRESAEQVTADLAARARHTKTKAELAERATAVAAGLVRAKQAETAAPIAAQNNQVGQHRARHEAAATAQSLAEEALAKDLAALELTLEPDADVVTATRALAAAETESVNRALAVWSELTAAEGEAAKALGAADKVKATKEALTTRLDELEAELAAERERLAASESKAALAPSRAETLAAAKANLANREKLDRVSEFIGSAQLGRGEAVETIDKGKRRLAELDDQAKPLEAEAATGEARQKEWEEAKKRQAQRGELDGLDEAITEKKRRVNDAQTELDRVLLGFQASTGPRLAELLVEGEPCSVCGSLAHPNPATADGDHDLVGADEVARCQARLTTAVVAVSECEAERKALLDSLGERATAHPEEFAAAVAEAAAGVDATAEAAQELTKNAADRGRVATEIERAEASLKQVEAELSELTTARAEAEGALGEARLMASGELTRALAVAQAESDDARGAAESIESLRRRVGELVESIEVTRKSLGEASDELTRTLTSGERASDRVAELSKRVSRDSSYYGERQVSLARLSDRVDELDACRRRTAEVEASLLASTQTLNELLDKSDHGDLDSALALCLDSREGERLVANFESWNQQSGAVDALLSELATKNLPEVAPDVLAAQRAEAEARTARDRQATRVTEADTHISGVGRALAAIAASEAGLADQRAAAQQITDLADVCAGKGELKVSLEAWVLAAHLRDVVAAANLHLVPMSNGRYELSVADAPLTKKRQGGLDLVISDSRTGKDRPVASLSGGETFQASLALALGLADVVTSNQGGLRIDALFVDEGFGSLDADALDQAISVLDGLRSRGSLVGIITHVDALKEALTVGLEIRPGPTGSELIQLA